MKVKAKRPKIIFQGRRVLSVHKHPRSSDEQDTSSKPRRMTPIENDIPTALEGPVESISEDGLEQLSQPEYRMGNDDTENFLVPQLFTSLPPIRDALVTDTSLSQDRTARDCLPLHAGTSRSLFDLNPQGIPRLNREAHINFLNEAIQNAIHIPYDALRPWIIYWTLTGLSVLGENLERWRNRVLETFSPMQNPSGGFGGGPGQTSHAACTYAAVLSLAMIGGGESLNLIDRRALWVLRGSWIFKWWQLVSRV